jgi:hypothetical protein
MTTANATVWCGLPVRDREIDAATPLNIAPHYHIVRLESEVVSVGCDRDFIEV